MSGRLPVRTLRVDDSTWQLFVRNAREQRLTLRTLLHQYALSDKAARTEAALNELYRQQDELEDGEEK
jgi:hypothetical protein